MTEVIIDTAGPTITVRADDALDIVAAKAMELFRDAMALYPLPKPIEQVGFIHTERPMEDFSYGEPVDPNNPMGGKKP